MALNMASKKRQMMFIPAINPTSFVLFFEKGDTGLSWSIHDYSEWGKSNKKGKWDEHGQFRLYKRNDYRWTADQVREKAKYPFDAPTIPTAEHEEWRKRIPDKTDRKSTKSGAITRSEIIRVYKGRYLLKPEW
jgi:hypothetical protein